MNFELPTVRDSAGSTAEGMLPGKWWHKDDDSDRVICDLCPRECAMKDGDRGFCFVRQNVGGEMMLTTYGRSTGFCIDPIEKKPLNHFYPGTSVLSFGTAGCNLGCKFCQNWDISKAREVERLSHRAFPEEIALAAKSLECHSVAYTYNDPIVWAEYAIETAKACRQHDVKSVAVTAGYITEQARGPFFEYMDAANVDLKAFTEEFYYKITYAHLEPILDTLKWLRHETDVWFEITNLIIPDANDKPDEIRKMADWVLDAVGDDVPVHFSAFHPDFRMTDRPNTPHETLILARDLAIQTGLKHVYVGNVNDVDRQSTYCPNCRKLVVERNWYALGVYDLEGNQCRHCGESISGKFAERPGSWGRKRQPVDMKQFHIDGLSAGSNNEPASNGDTMSAGKNEQSGGDAKHGVKINDSALEWLAGQGDNQNSAPPAPVPTQPQTPAPATQPIPTRMPLSNEQREAIRVASAEVVKACIDDRDARIPDLNALGVGNAVVSGIFVSLKRQGRLRSCMGSFGATMPLLKTLVDSSRRTATADPRFPRISAVEVPHLELEVWLLFAPEPVNVQGEARIGEVTIGTHGLQIVRGNQRGLLLPGVATDNGWDSEEFLDNVCIKAGLSPTAWKEPDTILFRFEGNCIKGGLLNGDADNYSAPRLYYQPEQIEEMGRICKGNVEAIVRGATPMYYCGTVPDSSVNGVSITVTLPGGGNELTVARMSLKELMPLQSTAFTLCEELAASLKRRGFLNGNFELDLAVVSDAAMHGTVDQPLIEGVDTSHRGFLINERQKNAWVYDREKSPTEVLADTAQACQVREPAYGMIYSLTFQATSSRVTYSAVPKPSRGPSDRPAAVAGKFYPETPAEMNAMLDEMLAGEATAEPCKAVMVPHAGWQFSGKLAADVLKRVRIPKRIIAIGPKHTPHGTDWAVAPHHNWILPEKNVASDYALAMKLVENIDGLEAQVVGITVGGGNLQRCEQFAEELAGVIREMDEPPLLLISSDMNHYANDDETRRLDTLALAELDRLDEDALFQTCRENHISMCGIVPAVIVLKTLKKLGSLHQSRQVGYATSADRTGDTSKVVGYAGRIFQ